MQYTGTRSRYNAQSAQVILNGIAPDGGLYLPAEIPKLSPADFDQLAKTDYRGRAKMILSLFLTDYPPEEIEKAVTHAYSGGRFLHDDPAPLVNVHDNVYLLELWHGPTCAFKDVALQILPFLLTSGAKLLGDDNTQLILVATSGDTGKAALEGFKDVPGTKILVFYPGSGVSAMQKLQMTAQQGSNVSVCGITGNFDDAQNGVKQIFGDVSLREKLARQNIELSSANSINWGRLVPQIVYYVSAYLNLQNEGKAENGLNIAVPTGNFGNILAAYYAKMMGVPVQKLICASNQNNVLTDFINTGVYDRNRGFYTTASPSMDILISSNLERLLYLLTGQNENAVAGWMSALQTSGTYKVDGGTLQKLQETFIGEFCDDHESAKTIRDYFRTYGYLPDTHTAVAINTCERYFARTDDTTPTVIASTASPYKFSGSVLQALDIPADPSDEFEMVDKLHEYTGVPVPEPIAALKGQAARFEDVCEIDGMADQVLNFIK